MTSLQDNDPQSTSVSVNGSISPVELDAEWSPEFAERQAREFAARGAEHGVLPNSILFDHGLSNAVKVAMMAMTVYSEGGRLRVSQYHLAKRLGVSRQWLSETMREAVKAGLLHRQEIDGEVVWRLRWLSFKRQPIPDAERQPIPDSQAVPDAPRARTHAQISRTSLTTSTSVKSRSVKPPPLPLTDDERAKLHARFDQRFPRPDAVDEIIEEALNHPARLDKVTEYAYVRGWIRREALKWDEHAAKMKAEQAREQRFKTPYGAPTVNPYTTEPAPFLTKDARDLPPSRDRTHDR